MGSGRSRRIVGVVVLAAALVLAFLVARGASFPQAGHPVVAWPRPPAVGTCQEQVNGGLRTVPCSEPHDLEITRDWQAIDTPPTDLGAACDAAAETYLGDAADPGPVTGWRPDAPHYTAYWLPAPPEDVVGGRGWTVCVIGPWRPSSYTGSVHDLASPAGRPAAYGICGVPGEPTLVPCDEPHGWEQLGQATEDLPAAGGVPSLASVAAAHQASCRTLAASLIGVSDPTYHDRLRIVVDVMSGFSITVSDQGAGHGVTSGSSPPARSPARATGTTSPAASATPTQSAAPTTRTGRTASHPAIRPTVSATPTRSPVSTGTLHSTGAPTSGSTVTPSRPGRPVAVLTCQVLDVREQLVGTLMGLGNRPLPVN